MIVAIIGLFVGIAIGMLSGLTFPAGYSAYVAMGILACMDSVLGGVYANLLKHFEWKIFATGFFFNGILAMALIFLGHQLSIDLSIAAVVVYGSRIFNNFTQIRRFWLNKDRKKIMIETE